VDTQILSPAADVHGSGVRSLETVVGSGHRLVRVECLGAFEHLVLGGRVTNRAGKQHWRPGSHQILQVLPPGVCWGVHTTPFATLISMLVATDTGGELYIHDEERTG
jgi:hypothetical protein